VHHNGEVHYLRIPLAAPSGFAGGGGDNGAIPPSVGVCRPSTFWKNRLRPWPRAGRPTKSVAPRANRVQGRADAPHFWNSAIPAVARACALGRLKVSPEDTGPLGMAQDLDRGGGEGRSRR
jgi:hypothetical protein